MSYMRSEIESQHFIQEIHPSHKLNTWNILCTLDNFETALNWCDANVQNIHAVTQETLKIPIDERSSCNIKVNKKQVFQEDDNTSNSSEITYMSNCLSYINSIGDLHDNSFTAAPTYNSKTYYSSWAEVVSTKNPNPIQLVNTPLQENTISDVTTISNCKQLKQVNQEVQ